MIFGVSMMKDEADIAGPIIEHLLAEGVDHLLIADNLSKDGTRDVLHSYPQVTVVDDEVFAYYQAEKMTRLCHQAAGMGATWIVPFDADELWYWPDGTLAEFFATCEGNVVKASTLHHIPHADDVSGEPNPILRMRHRAERPKIASKVAFRYDPTIVLHMGNHDVVAQQGQRVNGLEIREFQYRSFDHFVRKVRNGKAVYDASDLSDGYGIHWRKLGAMTTADLEQEWAEYLATPTVYDPAPLRAAVRG